MNMRLLRVHPLCFSSILWLGACKFCSIPRSALLLTQKRLNVSCIRNRSRTEIVRTPMVPLPMPMKLRFNITPEVKRDIERAKQNMNMYVNKVMIACYCLIVDVMPF